MKFLRNCKEPKKYDQAFSKCRNLCKSDDKQVKPDNQVIYCI